MGAIRPDVRRHSGFAVLGFLSDRLVLVLRRRVLRGQLIGTQEEVMS